MGAPEVPPLCRETQSLGQQMFNAPFGINGISIINQDKNQKSVKNKVYEAAEEIDTDMVQRSFINDVPACWFFENQKQLSVCLL